MSIEQGLDRAMAAVREGGSNGLRRGLEHIRTVSNQHVPIDPDLKLERSSKVTVEGLRGVVSYDEPYAVIQHERLDYHHDAGRNAKFLENAINSEVPAVREIMAAEIRRALGT